MKYPLIALLMSTLSAWTLPVQANCAAGGELARDFINAYAKRQEPALVFVTRSTQVTENFKQGFTNAVTSAAVEADPVLDGLDAPSSLKVLSCDEKTQLVTLVGPDPRAFKLVVKLTASAGGWLVDGSGSVNIPRAQRASR